MAYNKVTQYGDSENILESEIGLVTKTVQAAQSMASAVDGRKVIKAGALFDDTAEGGTGMYGVVLHDYDMTDYDEKPIAIVVQGRLKADKVSSEAASAKSDLAARGLYLV